MLWYLPQLFNTRVFHFDIGIKPFGYCMTDEGGTFFFQQFNLALLFLY